MIRYGLGVGGLTSAGVIDTIARTSGCILTGNGDVPDRGKATKILLWDYRNGGELNHTSLER